LVGFVWLEHDKLDGDLRVRMDLTHVGDHLAAERLPELGSDPRLSVGQPVRLRP
jgi:hypothetical protein